MFLRLPVRRLSMQTTSKPSRRSRSQRWLPINPAPPVTRARFFAAKVLIPPDAPVEKTGVMDRPGIQGVTAVHEELRRLHQRGGPTEVQGAQLLPLRHQHRRVRASQGLVRIEDDLKVWQEVLGLFAGDGIVADGPHPALVQ